MLENELKKEYFEWLYYLVCDKRFSEQNSYRKLFEHLHNTEFVYFISMDDNRAKGGIDLRYRFGCSIGYKDISEYLDGPCSVLEMMIALAIRCEEQIMDDPAYGDRTGQWFWGMIVNLGLGAMTDNRYDEKRVDDILDRFLSRTYEPDGKGGLFTVRNCDVDMRKVEIWKQLLLYLDSLYLI